MKRLQAIAAAIALCLLLPATPAATAAECATRPQLEQFIAQRLPGGRIMFLAKDDATHFLAALAAATASPEMAADALAIVDAGLPVLKVVVFVKGCITRIGTIDRRLVTRILVALSRAGA